MKTLVAGVGNIFFGDDGFGLEVARLLGERPMPEGVRVADFGIRGIHLAFELLSGYDRAFLIDAVSRGGEPGTLYVIEPDLNARGGVPDSHSMELQSVFAFMHQLEGPRPLIEIIGCEPSVLDDRMELSEPVRRALPAALAVIERKLGDSVYAASPEAIS
ncbi:MAG: hydrogenase maturation protease [Candidatus Eremiobacteraeota bacterium]|nr:hydrogenase maturation protease [Candidatus Eremiobacteraeota bacterium]